MKKIKRTLINIEQHPNDRKTIARKSLSYKDFRASHSRELRPV